MRERVFARCMQFVFTVTLMLVTGCHLDMSDQPKYKPLAADPYFADGASERMPVEGTLARGHLVTDSLLATGKKGGDFVDLFPFAITDSVVRRGQNRFDTFCSPCHGRRGDGNGMIVQRGFPRPPSLLSDSMRAQPAGFYFDVITNGFGRMYSYAPSVPVPDRWAIVAYLRALQLSSGVRLSDLPEQDRKRMSGATP